MPPEPDQLQIKETYTYTREVSGQNPERLVELLQEARRVLGGGASPQRLNVILDEALQEAAGTSEAPALAQSPASDPGDVRLAEASAGEQAGANPPQSAVGPPDRSESQGTNATQGAMGGAAELSNG